MISVTSDRAVDEKKLAMTYLINTILTGYWCVGGKSRDGNFEQKIIVI